MLETKKEQNRLMPGEIKFTNKEIFITFLDVVSFIALSLVIFGIFSLGFFVAPVIFKNLTPRPLASEIMTDIFLRYYPFAFVCSLIALLNDSMRFFLSFKISKNKKTLIIRLACIFAVCVMIGYSDKKLLPEINQMRLEQKGPTLWTNNHFTELHKQSEKLGKLSFIVGLIPLILIITLRKKV